MGEDKSLLNYYGIPQRYFVYEMLQSFCKKVFLSCNQEQEKSIPDNYNLLPDDSAFKNIGPMAALLSAFEKYAGASFLVVGCDYPFIKREDLEKLVETRNENSLAVSYFNNESGIEEPLLAIYEYASYPLMKNNFLNKKYSLRYFLKEVNAMKIIPSNPETIMSVDTAEQYQLAMQVIRDRN